MRTRDARSQKPDDQVPKSQVQNSLSGWRPAYEQRAVAHQEMSDARRQLQDAQGQRPNSQVSESQVHLAWRLAWKQRVVARQEISDAQRQKPVRSPRSQVSGSQVQLHWRPAFEAVGRRSSGAIGCLKQAETRGDTLRGPDPIGHLANKRRAAPCLERCLSKTRRLALVYEDCLKDVYGCLESANDARGRPKKSEERSPRWRPPSKNSEAKKSEAWTPGDIPEAEPLRQRSPQRPREKTAEAKYPESPGEGTPLRDRVSGSGMSRQTPRAGLSRRPAVIQRGSPIAGGSEVQGTRSNSLVSNVPQEHHIAASPRGEAVTPPVDRGGEPSRSMPDGSAKTVEAARDRQSAGRRSLPLRRPKSESEDRRPKRSASRAPHRGDSNAKL